VWIAESHPRTQLVGHGTVEAESSWTEIGSLVGWLERRIQSRSRGWHGRKQNEASPAFLTEHKIVLQGCCCDSILCSANGLNQGVGLGFTLGPILPKSFMMWLELLYGRGSKGQRKTIASRITGAAKVCNQSIADGPTKCFAACLQVSRKHLQSGTSKAGP
jgi:hypothetical protein